MSWLLWNRSSSVRNRGATSPALSGAQLIIAAGVVLVLATHFGRPFSVGDVAIERALGGQPVMQPSSIRFRAVTIVYERGEVIYKS